MALLCNSQLLFFWTLDLYILWKFIHLLRISILDLLVIPISVEIVYYPFPPFTIQFYEIFHLFPFTHLAMCSVESFIYRKIRHCRIDIEVIYSYSFILQIRILKCRKVKSHFHLRDTEELKFGINWLPVCFLSLLYDVAP